MLLVCLLADAPVTFCEEVREFSHSLGMQTDAQEDARLMRGPSESMTTVVRQNPICGGQAASRHS